MNELDDMILTFESNREIQRRVKQKQFARRVFKFLNGVFTAFLIFSCFLASMYIIEKKSIVYELNQKNLLLEKDASELKGKISEMNVLISSQLSLDNIEKIARDELRMVYPDASRVIALNSSNYYALSDTDDYAASLEKARDSQEDSVLVSKPEEENQPVSLVDGNSMIIRLINLAFKDD